MTSTDSERPYRRTIGRTARAGKIHSASGFGDDQHIRCRSDHATQLIEIVADLPDPTDTFEDAAALLEHNISINSLCLPCFPDRPGSARRRYRTLLQALIRRENGAARS